MNIIVKIENKIMNIFKKSEQEKINQDFLLFKEKDYFPIPYNVNLNTENLSELNEHIKEYVEFLNKNIIKYSTLTNQ